MAYANYSYSSSSSDCDTQEGADEELLRLCQYDSGYPAFARILKEFTETHTMDTDAAVNWKWQNALHVICANYEGEDLSEVVRILVLDAGIPVNSVDDEEKSALHHLIMRDDVQQVYEVVDFLIKSGIDIQCRDMDGNSALHLLCSRRDKDTPIDLILLLLHNWLDVSLLNGKCETALHVLCKNTRMCHRVDIAQAMIAFGFDLVDAESVNGCNALHLLFELEGNNDIKEMAFFLITQGIDVNKPTNDYMCPLHLLCKNYNGDDIIEIMEILIDCEADIRRETQDEKNLLHLVLRHYTNDEMLISVVDYLVASGLDVCGKDSFEQIPLSYLYDRDVNSMPDANTTRALLGRMERYGVKLLDTCTGGCAADEEPDDKPSTSADGLPNECDGKTKKVKYPEKRTKKHHHVCI